MVPKLEFSMKTKAARYFLSIERFYSIGSDQSKSTLRGQLFRSLYLSSQDELFVIWNDGMTMNMDPWLFAQYFV